MTKRIPKHKFEKLSTEAAINATRLHFDSILLYKNKSYPTAFHVATLALEELAKSRWIDRYVFYASTNDTWLTDNDEQEWLQLLYVHTKKQSAYVEEEYHEISPKFYQFVKNGKLEFKKQKSIYVGLEKNKRKINTKSKISLPTQIKSKDAKQIISLNNDVLIATCKRNIENGHYYGPWHKYHFLHDQILSFLEREWKYKSGLLGKKWWTIRRKKSSS